MSPRTADTLDKNSNALITIDGQPHPTVADAARILGVSTKAVNDYIRKGVIPPPPTVEYGLRDLNVYPRDYMDVARERIREYRKLSKRSRQQRPRDEY